MKEPNPKHQISFSQAEEYIKARFPEAQFELEDDGMLVSVSVNLNMVFDPEDMDMLISPEQF